MDFPSNIDDGGSRLSADPTQAPGNEGHVLSLLRLVQHPCIVRLISSYTYLGKYNLLFERAENDLSKLLSSPERPLALTTDDSLYQAMQGLCSAVAAFHHFAHPNFRLSLKGYHHDLKPDNILVNGSRFLLSDFGLSSMKELDAKSKTLSKDIMGFYRSPESEDVENMFKSQLVGQPNDIWALGCILAVLLTYIRKGAAGVVEFEQRRRHKVKTVTTYTFHCGGEANPAVDGWLTELESSATANTPDRGLIFLIRDMLKIDPSSRPNAKTVSTRTDFLAAQSLYYSIVHVFDKLLHADIDPIISIERDRVALFGQELEIYSINREWREVNGLSATIAEYEFFRQKLVTLWQDLDILAEQEPRKDSYSHLVMKRVRSSIDELWNFLPPAIKSKLESTLESKIVATEDTEILDKIHSNFKEDLNYRNIGLVAAIRSMIISMNRGEVKSSGLSIDSDQVSIKTEIAPFANLATVGENGRTVLVALLEYDQRWRGKIGTELKERVEEVAELLHREEKPLNFRSLHCIHYFHSTPRHSFGLVLELPSTKNVGISPGQSHVLVSLADLINRTRSQRKRPSLGDIFKLAEALATTVLAWHKVGWVHRAISAYNIIVFNSLESPFEGVTEPYVLGFQFSRPNEPDSVTLGPPDKPELIDYCHPEYLKGSARHAPEFDYYSLGLVLLEIGRWKTIKSIASEFNDSDQSPENLKKWLLSTHVKDLHMIMGNVYQQAVETCLNFHTDLGVGESISIPLDTLREFEANVVGKIKLCFA